MQHRCNLAAKESGLECTRVNNGDFAVLVGGGGRCHWVNMCTVWLSHMSKSCSHDLEGHSCGQLVIGSFIMATHFSCITSHADIFDETSNHPGDSAPYSPDLASWDFWQSPWKGRDFRPSVKFREIQWGSWWWLGELCQVPRCLLWRGLKCHCPITMFLVPCIFFNKCLLFIYMTGSFPDRPLINGFYLFTV